MSNDLESKQQVFIVKSNNLVEARYRLSLQESQVILWLLTQIRPDDEDFKSHKLNIVDFAELLNLNVNGQYTKMQKITENLMRRIMKIKDSQKQELLQVAWLSSAHYKLNQGFVSLKFDPLLKPYLLQLKSHFTKINIADTLKLKSVHAIRIFELLLQYQAVGCRKITIEELRAYCGIEKQEYKLLADFKRKVIERAKTEINAKTEYCIDYREIKESRKVVEIEWSIKKKNLEDEKLQAQIKTLENELNTKDDLVVDLQNYGLSKSLSLKLVEENAESVIKNALLAVAIQISRDNVKNPKAMLKTAIKEQWHPQVYRSRKGDSYL